MTPQGPCDFLSSEGFFSFISLAFNNLTWPCSPNQWRQGFVRSFSPADSHATSWIIFLPEIFIQGYRQYKKREDRDILPFGWSCSSQECPPLQARWAELPELALHSGIYVQMKTMSSISAKGSFSTEPSKQDPYVYQVSTAPEYYTLLWGKLFFF